MAQARRENPVFGARVEVFVKRAWVSSDMANVARTSEPLKSAHEAIACELQRQAAYWATCGLLESRGQTPEANEPSRVWDALDDRLLSKGEASPTELRELVSKGSFVSFAELSMDEQRRAQSSLDELTRAVLDELDARNIEVRALRFQRTWRLSLIALAIVGSLFAVTEIREARLRASELAVGKPWRISSNYSLGGCSSPDQECPGNTGYFFHTTEVDPSPWVEFDLGKPVHVARVDAENRSDCCAERAIPLTVEVSTDHTTWRAVARRDSEFSTWRATFASTEARWVRLRVLKRGALHLRSVRIYP